MPHEEQREKNIRLVTEVALDCFLANGIEKTKVADIALRSGLTERSAFRYFETKADLVLAASLLYWKRILERIDRMSHTASDSSTTGLQDAENAMPGAYDDQYAQGIADTLDKMGTASGAGFDFTTADSGYKDALTRMVGNANAGADAAAATADALSGGYGADYAKSAADQAAAAQTAAPEKVCVAWQQP